MNSRKEYGSTTKTVQKLLNAPRHVNRRNLIFSDEEEDTTDPVTKPYATPHKQILPTPNKFFKSGRKKPLGSVRKKENAENKNILDSLETEWGSPLSNLVLKVPSDLPLSSLNTAPLGPSQPDGENIGLPSPKTTSKARSKVGQKIRMSKSLTRGKNTPSLSQSPGEANAQEDTAPVRGRTRGARAASSSTSKAKVVSEPKPATRTRAYKSLRLI